MQYLSFLPDFTYAWLNTIFANLSFEFKVKKVFIISGKTVLLQNVSKNA